MFEAWKENLGKETVSLTCVNDDNLSCSSYLAPHTLGQNS